jgi:ligand-binding SRPBCC domain-containing protein
MRTHVLERVQRVAATPEESFAAFGDIRNLERMTPPWLHFRVLTDHSLVLSPGALIQYRLRLHRFPIDWTTEIVEWEPGRRFVDVQRRGPYALWEHTHTFTPFPAGTAIEDRVRYALPLGPLGALAHVAFVRRDLRRIFDYRRDATEVLLGPAAAGAESPLRSA